ncbi:MAG: trigger factor [Nitrospinaceae bacterium]|jgi:trigger factor|nr:trigger factor [Nitrospina sp.]MBT5869142.1 trigger factor [Nitrospinaceae bacterium]MBT6346671.1 trigger factor [Nitrospina sp.]
MEFDVEELEGLKRKINITIPKEVMVKRINDAYKVLNRQANIPGFRPGKIPQKVLEKQVPLQSLSDMFQELMQEYYEEALHKTGLKPTGQPEIDHAGLQDIKKDEPLTFAVLLDVKPDLKVKDYKGLKFNKKEAVVKEEEIDETLVKVLSRQGTVDEMPAGYKVEDGDILTLDFQGTMHDQPLENGSAENFELRVGEKKMLPGFEDQLIGHVQDEEFEIRVMLPADWNQKVRRVSFPVPGATDEQQEDDRAAFKIKIKQVRKLHLPELTDEIAQREGFETTGELRRAIKIDLQNHKDQDVELKIKEDIFNILVKDAESGPPESLIERELKFMIEGMKYQIAQSGMKIEDSGFEPEKAMKEWREKAIFNTTGYMMLEAVAGAENIHVTQQDMEGEYELLAKQTKQKVEEIQKRIMSNPDSLNQTTTKILGQKAMNFIYSNCEFKFYKEGEEPVKPAEPES